MDISQREGKTCKAHEEEENLKTQELSFNCIFLYKEFLLSPLRSTLFTSLHSSIRMCVDLEVFKSSMRTYELGVLRSLCEYAEYHVWKCFGIES